MLPDVKIPSRTRLYDCGCFGACDTAGQVAVSAAMVWILFQKKPQKERRGEKELESPVVAEDMSMPDMNARRT